jgi:hypothetical protein
MMAGNTQSAGGNAAAYVQEQERQQQFIKNIADLPETEAKAAIHKQAHNEVGKYGKDVVAVREGHITEDLAKYKEITPFDKVAGVFAQNSVTSTTAFNKDGFAGHTAKVQQQIPLPSEAGAIWGNVSVNQDAKGNVTGGAVGVNHVGVPVTIGGVDVVEVGNATFKVPKDGKINPANMSLLVGGIAKAHGDIDATNYTAAVITNGKFDDLSVYGRASKPLYRENGLEVTGYGEAIYNVPNEQLGVNAGVAPHAGEAQDPVQAKLEHFYELPRNEQRAIVSHMTDIYVKHNPGVGHEEAQAKVLHEILNPQHNQEAEHSHGYRVQ